MFAKNCHLHWIAGTANILSKYSHIFFNFGLGSLCYCGSFPMLFPKAPASCCTKNLNWFLLHCTSMLMNSKSVSQIFKILFQTGDINIFVHCGIFFSRYVKAPFLTKKTAVKSETYFSRGSYRKLTWQSIKRKFHHWQKLGLHKVIHNATLHWKR